MKKNEYVETISKELNLTKKDVNNVINLYIEELKKEIVNNTKISITNFGTFTKTTSKAFSSFSPIDGSLLPKQKYIRISFKCSKEFKKMLTGDKQ